MGKKCCVYGCKSNYLSEKKKKATLSQTTTTATTTTTITTTATTATTSTETKIQFPAVFRFPSDNDERQRWIDVIGKINANLIVNNETVVCENHWPTGYETIKKKGRYRTKYPLSVFEGIPQSIIPNPPPNARQTKRTSNHERNTFPDELSEFNEYDRVTFSILQDNVLSNKRHFCVPITSFVNSSSLYLQSLSYVDGTPSFLIIISESLKFDAFHLGVKCYVNSLSKNRINTVHRWSTLEEVIRFLNFKELNNKMVVMIEQMAAMSATPACTKIYDADIIVQAFEYFSAYRSLYNCLRVDYQLPSIQTLMSLTSKVSKLSEANFLQ